MLKGIRREKAYTCSVKALLIVAALASALLVTGCQSAESKVVGKWKGPNNMGGFELKADKTFTSDPPLQVAGTWKLEDKNVLLATSSVQGKSVKQFMDDTRAAAAKANAPKEMVEQQLKMLESTLKEMKMQVGEDGKTMSFTDPASKQSVTLTKEESK